MHNSDQQEEFIKLLKAENNAMTTKINSLTRKLEKLQKRYDEQCSMSEERKVAVDNLSAELSKIKRKLARKENSK